jgi:hypothetical protein
MQGVTKKMQLFAYIASKPNRMATYPELVEVFVRKRGWSTKLLNAYLSELARHKHLLKRSWLKAREGRVRIYRINEDYIKHLTTPKHQ